MEKLDANILVLDDDADVLTSAKLFLKRYFTDVQVEENPNRLNKLLSQQSFDVVLLDMNFKRGDQDGKAGLYWLNHILSFRKNTSVILMTAYGDVELAVKGIRNGASDFILKPWRNEKLLATVSNCAELRHSNRNLERVKGVNEKLNIDKQISIVGQSRKMKKVMETIDKVASTDANILILGENGTGKEVVARALHNKSLRRKETFIGVDLGAINENLFESELFGHVKGAFTDAHDHKAGRFELANDGTIFLDEIGNLSVPLQAKLLAVLENRKINRLGSGKDVHVDVRVISATNKPIHEMVTSNEFRQDLLYRINTVEIRLPSLRERIEDIPLLAEFFLRQFTRKYNKQNLKFSQEVIPILQKYSWPGNIRELRHTIERSVILSESGVISGDDFLLDERKQPSLFLNDNLNLNDIEKLAIIQAIDKCKGNISRAAKELGITRTALYRRLEKHDI